VIEALDLPKVNWTPIDQRARPRIAIIKRYSGTGTWHFE